MTSERRIERIHTVSHQRQQGLVVLEDIHDPHNAEAVLRTCEAIGIQHICFIFEKAHRFKPHKVGKSSSSSANRWLSYSFYASTEECLTTLKLDGFELIATVLRDDSEALWEMEFGCPKTALMLGNERAGLSETAIALADRMLMIPMRGMVQSLNLSVTAAICLAEIHRQRLVKGIENYLLPVETASEIEQAWLERDRLVR